MLTISNNEENVSDDTKLVNLTSNDYLSEIEEDTRSTEDVNVNMDTHNGNTNNNNMLEVVSDIENEVIENPDNTQQDAQQPFNSDCPVCFQSIENAVIFTCNHSICLNCLQSMYWSQGKKEILCPLCRNEIEESQIKQQSIGETNSHIVINNPSRRRHDNVKSCVLYFICFIIVGFLFLSFGSITSNSYNLLIFDNNTYNYSVHQDSNHHDSNHLGSDHDINILYATYMFP
jgi:hypothetical protein